MIKVLVVEDDSLISFALDKMITGLGHRVTGVASEGPEALESIRAHKPDLVLLDIMLKGEMDGIDVAGWINQNQPGLPFFFLTGNSDPATVMRAMGTNPFGFLMKPVHKRDISELITRVESSLIMRGA